MPNAQAQAHRPPPNRHRLATGHTRPPASSTACSPLIPTSRSSAKTRHSARQVTRQHCGDSFSRHQGGRFESILAQAPLELGTLRSAVGGHSTLCRTSEVQIVQVTANPSRPVPAMIGTGFGGLWAVMGALALPRPWTPWAAGAAVTISLILMARLWFAASYEGSDLFRRSAYRLAVALEILALGVIGYLLPQYGLQAYFVPAIGIIVGLHFIGLWRASGRTKYLWITATMCAVSTAAIALPAAGAGLLNERALFACYGNALVLWVAAARRPALQPDISVQQACPEAIAGH